MLTTLGADQLFRWAYIDPKMPDYNIEYRRDPYRQATGRASSVMLDPQKGPQLRELPSNELSSMYQQQTSRTEVNEETWRAWVEKGRSLDQAAVRKIKVLSGIALVIVAVAIAFYLIVGRQRDLVLIWT